MELRYTWIEFVDFGAGTGQYVGTLEGMVKGERLNGSVKFVNVPAKRPDNINCPSMRGILTSSDGAKLYVELNGIALLRQEDKARIFTTSLQMRSAEPQYSWVNTVFGTLEGILNTTTDVARARAYSCEHELTALP
jgi:hypothetical protein